MSRLMSGLHRLAEAVAATLLAVIFVAFLLQIAMRYVFNWPVGWTTELSLAAWLWLVLWGGAFVLRDHEEIRLDLLLASVGRRARRVLSGLGSLSIGALFALSLPATYDYVRFMRVEKSSYLKVPMDLMYAIYLVFALAVIARCAWRVLRLLRGQDPDAAPTTPP